MLTLAKGSQVSTIPIGTAEDWSSTWHRVCLTSVRFDPYSRGVFDAEQVIDHFEPLVSFWEINTADVHHGLKLALSVVAKKCEDGDNSGR